MATNSFDALVVDVNRKISEMNAAASNANGVTANAKQAVENANAAIAQANAAIEHATTTAQKANEEADAWDNAVMAAESVAEDDKAAVRVEEEDGAKKLTFSIPVGATGPVGPQGNPGKSGVTFTLSGTSLYITTN